MSERRLAGDLENLNAARSSPGGPERIIIYESPLQPVHARRRAAVPSPDAKRLRELTAATCKRLEFECHLGGTPDLDTFSTLAWSDASHPPAAALGAWINSLLGESVPCGGGKT